MSLVQRQLSSLVALSMPTAEHQRSVSSQETLIGDVFKSQCASPKDKDCFVQQIRTSCGQVVEFDYNSRTQRVTARLILPEGKFQSIQPENLPKELKSIPNALAFLSFLKSVAVRTSVLSDGKVKVYLDGRVLGGNPYEMALSNFKTHLDNLANMYTAMEISNRFGDICASRNIFHKDERYLFGFFEDLELPRDTQEALDALILNLVQSPKSNADILSDLRLISHRPTPQVWTELGVLFTLPEFRRLENGLTRQIWGFIEGGNKYTLRDFVKRVLTEQGVSIPDLNITLERMGRHDLDTLLGEVISKRPSRNVVQLAPVVDTAAGFREIEKAQKEMRALLIAPQNRALLDSLIENLAANNLASLDQASVDRAKVLFGSRLTEVIEKNATFFKLRFTESQVLRELVLEANYRLLTTDDASSDFIVKTMELFQGAYSYAKKLKGKRVVLFVGPTGAGKSATIARLLGATFQQRDDNSIEIVGDASQFPKIGQARGMSETLYTTAYECPNDPSKALADGPGEDDNRSEAHELCAHLSIDMAVEEADSIDTVVVVASIDTLSVNRGNALVELIESVQEKFPQAFTDPDQKNVHLLVTKGIHNPTLESEIENGVHFSTLFGEASVKELALHSSRGNMHELRQVQRRKRIWQILSAMHSKGQVKCLDIGNGDQRNRLLEAYTRTPAGGGLEYRSAMEGSEIEGKSMRRKFGALIQKVADTWANHILARYFKGIPDSIEETHALIRQKQAGIHQLDQEVKDAQEQAKGLTPSLKETQALIEQLTILIEKGKSATITQPLSSVLLNDLRERVNASIGVRKKDLEAEVVGLERKVDAKNKEREKVDAEIIKRVQTIAKNQREMEQLRAEIKALKEEPPHADVLRSIKYRPDEELVTYSLGDGVDQTVFGEVREPTEEEWGQGRSRGLARNYIGNLRHFCLISAAYNIAPLDAAARRVFDETHRSGEYVATMRHHRGTYDLGQRSSASRKQVLHVVRLAFNGTADLPWAEFVHEVPALEANDGEIAKRYSAIQVLEKANLTHAEHLSGYSNVLGLKKESLQLVNEVKELQGEVQEKKAQYEDLKTAAIDAHLNEMLDGQKASRDKLEQAITALNDPRVAHAKKEVLRREIAAYKEKLAELATTKRNFAIIIQTQKETAVALREFVRRVLKRAERAGPRREGGGQHLGTAPATASGPMASASASATSPRSPRNVPPLQEEYGTGFLQTCKSFADAHDSYQPRMEESCRKDLGEEGMRNIRERRFAAPPGPAPMPPGRSAPTVYASGATNSGNAYPAPRAPSTGAPEANSARPAPPTSAPPARSASVASASTATAPMMDSESQRIRAADSVPSQALPGTRTSSYSSSSMSLDDPIASVEEAHHPQSDVLDLAFARNLAALEAQRNAPAVSQAAAAASLTVGSRGIVEPVSSHQPVSHLAVTASAERPAGAAPVNVQTSRPVSATSPASTRAQSAPGNRVASPQGRAAVPAPAANPAAVNANARANPQQAPAAQTSLPRQGAMQRSLSVRERVALFNSGAAPR